MDDPHPEPHPDSLIDSIQRRIDANHAHLCDRLDDLRDSIHAQLAALLVRLDAHEDYHRRNEHRFGLVRLAERHPLRLAAAAFVAGGGLLAAAPESLDWLARQLGAWIGRW